MSEEEFERPRRAEQLDAATGRHERVNFVEEEENVADSDAHEVVGNLSAHQKREPSQGEGEVSSRDGDEEDVDHGVRILLAPQVDHYVHDCGRKESGSDKTVGHAEQKDCTRKEHPDEIGSLVPEGKLLQTTAVLDIYKHVPHKVYTELPIEEKAWRHH